MKNQGFRGQVHVAPQERRGMGEIIKPFAVVAASALVAGVLVVALGVAIDNAEKRVFANWKPAPERISVLKP